MRRNRSNNGYIGNYRIENIDQDGVGSTQKKSTTLDLSVALTNSAGNTAYVRPTNGNGFGATATCGFSGGILTSIYVSTGGTGYTVDPIVIISGGGGSTTYGIPTRTGNRVSSISPSFFVDKIEIIDPGIGYSNPPTITVAAPGTANATVTGSIGGTLMTVTAITTGTIFPGQIISGVGVVSGTEVVGYGSGFGTAGTYIVSTSQSVASTTITASGTATATTTINANGSISSLNLTYKGAKYTSVPTVSVVTVGTVPRVTGAARAILSSGTGYTSLPTVSILGGNTGSGALAFPIITGTLGSVSISSGGSGYTQPPTAILSDLNCFSATLPTSVSGGQLTGITLPSNFSGSFSINPTIEVSGWIPLPSVSAGEQKFVGAYAVYDSDTNYVAFNCQGAYTVDWGDGTSNSYASNALATKVYDRSTYAAINQNPYKGYKTVIITITPQAGQNLTIINLQQRHPSLPAQNAYIAQWLDIRVAGSNINTITLQTVNVTMSMLEQFEFVGTNALTSTVSMFNGCRNLRKIVSLDISNVTDASNMFNGCVNLTELPTLNTAKNQNFSTMFGTCSSLEVAPMLDTSSATNMTSMFQYCSRLKSVPLYDTKNVTTMTNMFFGCTSLVAVPLFNTTKNTSFNATFYGCSSLKVFPKLDFSNCTDTASMFRDCISLEAIPYKLNTIKVTSANSMFRGCAKLKQAPEMITSRFASCLELFYGCTTLVTVPFYDISSSNSTTYMFFGCSSLQTVPWMDTRNVTNSSFMFYQCFALRSIPLFDFSKVNTIQSMFYQCSSFTTVPKFNFESVTTAQGAFDACTSLIYVPSFNFRNCTTFNTCFQSCNNLQNIDVFNTQPLNSALNASSFNGMFNACNSLKELPAFDLTGKTNTTIYSQFLNFTFSYGNLSRIQCTGINQNMVFSNLRLGATALNEIFTNLATVGASGSNARTLTITNNPGVTLCNRGIATVKGWAISG